MVQRANSLRGGSIPNPNNPFLTPGIGASPLFRDLADKFCLNLNMAWLVPKNLTPCKNCQTARTQKVETNWENSKLEGLDYWRDRTFSMWKASKMKRNRKERKNWQKNDYLRFAFEGSLLLLKSAWQDIFPVHFSTPYLFRQLNLHQNLTSAYPWSMIPRDFPETYLSSIGRMDLPSISGGISTPPMSKNVGARSMFRTTFGILRWE